MKKLALITLLAATFPTLAQDFNGYLDNAKAAYADKDYELAKLELQDALKLITQQASNVLGDTFPPAPSGWQASELTTESNPMAGTQLSKTYRKGNSEINATLTHNSPMIASYAAVFANPMLMQGEKIRLGREHAMLQMDESGKSGELIFLVKGKYLIQIEGDGLSGKQTLIDLIKAWDIKTVKSLAVE